MNAVATILCFAACGLAKAHDFASVELDATTGAYSVEALNGNWRFSGHVSGPVTNIKNDEGKDRVGAFHELSFDWQEGGPVRGTIRWYDRSNVVWFRLHYLSAQPGSGVIFPNFSTFPPDLAPISFRDQAFASPTATLAKTSTPWLFLNPKNEACIFSPASNFLVAKMTGDLKSGIGEGLNVRLSGVPNGLDQDSVLALGGSVASTWDTWGHAMRRLYNRPDVRYDADKLLQSFGYWTDNGADYYYNYDLSAGYANSLLAVRKRYEEEGIPLSYLQLDSWWYSKTTDDPAGRPGHAKNSKLPEGSWNRYGGLLELRAHPDLFPNGLEAFHSDLGLPIAVHSRWIDRKSPYHEHYKISGVGAIDPRWWEDIAAYLKSNGVTCYEQDWLSAIYENSPEMASTVGVGDQFADGMAHAMSRDGLTMQYCMATPRFFLQGLKYPNLTTIRTSDDRFEPRKWANFLLVSQLAVELGIAPWCDVFKSSETGNLILSVLSCGPVGTGDSLGKEDVSNIQRAIRADGLIVKPDRSILPTDDAWRAIDGDRAKAVFTASTFTDHAAMHTAYVFAFPRGAESSGAEFSPKSFGIKGRAYLFDMVTREGRFVESEEQVKAPFSGGNFAYAMLAPVTANGIVLLGDLEKIVPTGKQRIGEIRAENGGLRIVVHFAPSEQSVTLSGISETPLVSRALAGKAYGYRPYSGHEFSFNVAPPAPGRDAVVWIGPQKSGR